jgi:glutamine synthetase
MKPVAFYPDPFREGDNIIVLCETFVWADDTFKVLNPANTNFRHFAKKIFDAGDFEKPWFGIE